MIGRAGRGAHAARPAAHLRRARASPAIADRGRGRARAHAQERGGARRRGRRARSSRRRCGSRRAATGSAQRARQRLGARSAATSRSSPPPTWSTAASASSSATPRRRGRRRRAVRGPRGAARRRRRCAARTLTLGDARRRARRCSRSGSPRPPRTASPASSTRGVVSAAHTRVPRSGARRAGLPRRDPHRHRARPRVLRRPARRPRRPRGRRSTRAARTTGADDRPLQGANYAVAADRARPVLGDAAPRPLDRLDRRDASATRPDRDLADRGLPPGLWVQGVVPGTGADRAGLRDGDYVVARRRAAGGRDALRLVPRRGRRRGAARPRSWRSMRGRPAAQGDGALRVNTTFPA